MPDEFSRKDIDHFLYLVAKEYKKQNRKNPEAELILIGGSSVVINYNFRDVTSDIDSIIKASSNIKEIESVIDNYSNIRMIKNDNNKGIAFALNKLMQYGDNNKYDVYYFYSFVYCRFWLIYSSYFICFKIWSY